MYEIQWNWNNNSTKTMYFNLITLSVILYGPQWELSLHIFYCIFYFLVLVLFFLRKKYFYFHHQMFLGLTHLVQNTFPVFKGIRIVISINWSIHLSRRCVSPSHDCKASQSNGCLSMCCHVLKGPFQIFVYLWRAVRKSHRPNRV